ncbi:hypothetical protein D3C85_1041330 [compost metagenome]
MKFFPFLNGISDVKITLPVIFTPSLKEATSISSPGNKVTFVLLPGFLTMDFQSTGIVANFNFSFNFFSRPSWILSFLPKFKSIFSIASICLAFIGRLIFTPSKSASGVSPPALWIISYTFSFLLTNTYFPL